MRMSRVLLVEDSEECQLVVNRALSNANIELLVAGSCQELREMIKNSGLNFDLAILDLVLPDGDGFHVLEDLRSAGMPSETPVFFLTSQSELNSKLTAFNLGADDYLVKPIVPGELRARVEMRLRKSNASVSEVLNRGELSIEMTVLRAFRNAQGKTTDLALTAKEFKILAFLVQHDNKVFTRAELVSAVWGNDVHILDRTVDSHIYGLRKKLGGIASYVECIPGAGYRFKVVPILANVS